MIKRVIHRNKREKIMVLKEIREIDKEGEMMVLNGNRERRREKFRQKSDKNDGQPILWCVHMWNSS